jgi:hypothetical protein
MASGAASGAEPARIRPRAGDRTVSGPREEAPLSPVGRAVMGLLVQGSLIAFGAYVAFSDAALPGASTLARCGVAALTLIVVVLVGEVSRLRLHMSQLIAALRAAGGGGAGVPRDDRAAVDVLVRALSSDDADVRAKAHKNLVRLTGQRLTMDPEAWQAWWKDAREGFVARDPAHPG